MIGPDPMIKTDLIELSLGILTIMNCAKIKVNVERRLEKLHDAISQGYIFGIIISLQFF